MHTHHARRVRGAGPARRVTLEDLHRWVDDGGAVRPDAEGEPPPVTWSPVALRARLEAQRALHAMPRRPRGRGSGAARVGTPAAALSRIRERVRNGAHAFSPRKHRPATLLASKDLPGARPTGSHFIPGQPTPGRSA